MTASPSSPSSPSSSPSPTSSPSSPSRRARRKTYAAGALLLAAAATAAFALTLDDSDDERDRGARGATPVESGSAAPAPADESLLALARRDASDALAVGRADAPVVMIEYSDFQCPFCGRFARETKPELLRRYVDEGILRIEWRNFPVFGEESQRAALAGWAAGRQKKFWEFHDVVYAERVLLAVYALGMAVPVFALALLWDRFDLGHRRWLRGRVFRVGPLSLHSTTTVGGALFVVLGVVFLAFDGTSALPSLLSTETEFVWEARLSAIGGAVSDRLLLLVLAGVAALGAAVVLLRGTSRRRETEEREVRESSPPLDRSPR